MYQRLSPSGAQQPIIGSVTQSLLESFCFSLLFASIISYVEFGSRHFFNAEMSKRNENSMEDRVEKSVCNC